MMYLFLSKICHLTHAARERSHLPQRTDPHQPSTTSIVRVARAYGNEDTSDRRHSCQCLQKSCRSTSVNWPRIHLSSACRLSTCVLDPSANAHVPFFHVMWLLSNLLLVNNICLRILVLTEEIVFFKRPVLGTSLRPK